jgi:hypothetical protein
MGLSNIIARKTGLGGVVTCMAPDVCKTPTPAGPVPIPYMIVAMLTTATKTSRKAKNTSKEIFTLKSRLTMCIGDQPGVTGGVVSNTFGGYCRPLMGNPMVLVDNMPVVETTHQFGMNCNGPEGPPNTIGMLAYFE